MTEAKGTITGINYTPEGIMLLVGDQRVRLADVSKIEDDVLKDRQNGTENQPSQHLAVPVPTSALASQIGAAGGAPKAPQVKPEARDDKQPLKAGGASMGLGVSSANNESAASGGNGIKVGGPFASR